MLIGSSHPERSPAYVNGAAALLGVVAVILAALGFQHIGGFQPCELCYLQRYAHYAALPLLFLALVLLGAELRRPAAMVFFLAALVLLAGAGVGVYQAGAEWQFWPGPQSCSGTQAVSSNAGNLLKDLSQTRVVRCDVAQWRLFGLSFAGWNVLASLGLFAASVRAAFFSAPS